MIGRLVDTHARRGRRLTYAALAVAGVAAAAVGVLVLTGDDEQARVGDRRAQRRPGHVPDRGARDRRAERPGQRLGARPRRGPARDGGARGQQRPAVLRPHGGGRGRGPGRRRRAMRGPRRAARARRRSEPGRSRFGDADQGETVLAFGFPQSAEPDEPASSNRGVVSAAHAVVRRSRRRRARVRGRDPHRHRAGSRVLGRAARGSRRPRRRASTPPRARSATTTGRCRAPTMRSTARRARTVLGTLRDGRSIALDRRQLRLPGPGLARRARTCRWACSCAARCRARAAARAGLAQQRPDRGRQRPRDRTYALRLVRRHEGDRERRRPPSWSWGSPAAPRRSVDVRFD